MNLVLLETTVDLEYYNHVSELSGRGEASLRHRNKSANVIETIVPTATSRLSSPGSQCRPRRRWKDDEDVGRNEGGEGVSVTGDGRLPFHVV